MFLQKCKPYRLVRQFSTNVRCLQSAETISIPTSNLEPAAVSPKIENLVNEIAKLTLFEVSELNTVLKKKLNLPDAPAMAFGAMPAPAAATEEADAPTAEKTNYTLKLVKFDETKKVALVKEIRGLMDDMNLVQAKKFIESAPVIVRADLSKEMADQLKETLTKVGAECTVD